LLTIQVRPPSSLAKTSPVLATSHTALALAAQTSTIVGFPFQNGWAPTTRQPMPSLVPSSVWPPPELSPMKAVLALGATMPAASSVDVPARWRVQVLPPFAVWMTSPLLDTTQPALAVGKTTSRHSAPLTTGRSFLATRVQVLPPSIVL
jgi:hypothetical protein